MDKKTITRFWSKVEKTDGCWLWTGCIKRDGYGKVRISQRSFIAHRVSWELSFGAIPDFLHVLHRCDNPACVRPEHLFLGTQRDNVADMDAKGRRGEVNMRGERHPQARLTEADVRLIRSSLEHRSVLARRFGVTGQAITDVRRRKSWKHV